jgi:hypothetical protein
MTQESYLYVSNSPGYAHLWQQTVPDRHVIHTALWHRAILDSFNELVAPESSIIRHGHIEPC